jgi:hypothetical protein
MHPTLPLSLEPSGQRLPALAVCLQTQKIKFKKLANFRQPICRRFQPRFHHNSTTIYHAKNHTLHAKSCKNPSNNVFSVTKK